MRFILLPLHILLCLVIGVVVTGVCGLAITASAVLVGAGIVISLFLGLVIEAVEAVFQEVVTWYSYANFT